MLLTSDCVVSNLAAMTHTYTILELSRSAYDEIKTKLQDVGYDHAFHQNEAGEPHIDMHGIAVAPDPRDDGQPEQARDEHEFREFKTHDGVAWVRASSVVAVIDASGSPQRALIKMSGGQEVTVFCHPSRVLADLGMIRA